MCAQLDLASWTQVTLRMRRLSLFEKEVHRNTHIESEIDRT